MKQIERLRGAKHRQRPELPNGEKVEVLSRLAEELSAIDSELGTQHESCVEMQATIGHMRARLREMQEPSGASESEDPGAGQPSA
jgi:hypothetical protein